MFKKIWLSSCIAAFIVLLVSTVASGSMVMRNTWAARARADHIAQQWSCIERQIDQGLRKSETVFIEEEDDLWRQRLVSLAYPARLVGEASRGGDAFGADVILSIEGTRPDSDCDGVKLIIRHR